MVTKTRHTTLIFLLFAQFASHAQASFSERILTPSDTLNKQRLNTLVIGSTLGGTATLAGLYQLWYADYPQTSFQFNNDNHDWLGMDKLGHATTAYYTAVTGIRAMRWAGVKNRKAIWYGALPGWLFLATVEIFDGFSEQWGFSTGDFIANTGGSALAIGQEALWQEQRIMLKFSFHESPYRKLRPEMLGESLWSSWLKDYNGQTYWLSVSPGSFGWDIWPEWLCLSAGYSGRGMITGDADNQASRPEFAYLERAPQFFASLDIDMTKIPVKNKFLRTLFHAINVVKIPFPAVEFSPGRGLRGHGIYF